MGGSVLGVVVDAGLVTEGSLPRSVSKGLSRLGSQQATKRGRVTLGARVPEFGERAGPQTRLGRWRLAGEPETNPFFVPVPPGPNGATGEPGFFPLRLSAGRPSQNWEVSAGLGKRAAQAAVFPRPLEFD